MTDQTETAPIRKGLLPCTPPPEWEFHTVHGARTGSEGCVLFPGDTGPVVVRRRVTYGDWEPVRPDRWADEPDDTDLTEADIDGMLAAGTPVQIVTAPPATYAAVSAAAPSTDQAAGVTGSPVKQRADCTELEWAEQERARFERLYTRETVRADLAEQRADTAARDADIYQRRLERLGEGYTRERKRAERAEAEAERLRTYRDATCTCGHVEQQHFEDACLVCDCGDYLTPAAAREELRRLAAEAPATNTQAQCSCPHPADEHSVYGCADGCGCEWMPKKPPMDPVRILGIADCPTPESHNWGCGCPTDQLPLHAESGVDTPGCDCGHDGMGPKWHGKACAWMATLTVPHPDDEPAVVEPAEAADETKCGPVPDQCGDETGEPCVNHERQQAHAEGEHCLCGPECTEGA